MLVLLVYPTCPETFWSFKTALKYISKKSAFPPLGLMTVGAMLPEDWDVALVDTNVRPLLDRQIREADMIFVSAMLVQRTSAKEIIARCKAMGKTVVAGGPLFTSQHEHFPEVDHFVLNEAEVTLPHFLADLDSGRTERFYTSDVRPDIAGTPVPNWSLISMKDYATMSVQYSRGCPFNCEFCDIVIMNGRTPRTKGAKQFLAEMESLYQAGWRGGVFIVDDNFIGNKQQVKQMLPGLIGWQKTRDYPFQFMTEASTDMAEDAELMRLMSEANFHKVFLGIETPEKDSLKECGKHQNEVRDMVETVRIIQRNGMQVMGGFIVGFDSDLETTFEAQIRFIQQVGIVTAMVGLLTALPHTRLWSRLMNEKRLVETASGDNTSTFLNFVPRMPKTTLLRGYRHIIGSLYSRRMYYRRIHIFLEQYNPTVRTHVTWCDIKAFVNGMSHFKVAVIC